VHAVWERHGPKWAQMKRKRGSTLCVRFAPYSKHCDFFADLVLFGHNYIMALVPRTLEVSFYTFT
jgi:hypothetical protein